MVVRGFTDPRRENPGQTNLDRAFSAAFSFWRDEDPPVRQQQGLPNSTIRWIALHLGSATQERLRVTADLIVVAYFYLLRICEYTQSSRPTRTVPLRRQDIQLWNQGAIIAHTAPLADLLRATGATINLENQKNGKKGGVVHHAASGDPDLDPIPALARLVHRIAHLPATTPLGTFELAPTRLQRVSPGDITSAVRLGAIGDNLADAGYSLDRIGSHSLRSGGAINLALNGYDQVVIMKMGRWSSNTFLTYIQSQIGELTQGISTSMARPMRFHRVGT